jgi:2-oxoglutarate ferredoxin oxidoreductase subunit beta
MSEKIIYERPVSWIEGIHTHYCPGCTHGIVHRMLCETLDEFKIRELTIGIAPVGCAALMYNYIDIDFIEAPHGRAPAVATGCKRVRPDSIVFTYQGDGDLASIGTAEIVHAANRSENITVFFINNATYGMTGGQMAPTTLIGQRTTTCRDGREPGKNGYPIRMSEMLATLEAPAYIERVSAAKPAHLPALKRAIKKAFQNQMSRKGFSFVEVLSTCPTNWGMSPVEACNWLAENMIPYYPIGLIKDFKEELM